MSDLTMSEMGNGCQDDHSMRFNYGRHLWISKTGDAESGWTKWADCDYCGAAPPSYCEGWNPQPHIFSPGRGEDLELSRPGDDPGQPSRSSRPHGVVPPTQGDAGSPTRRE